MVLLIIMMAIPIFAQEDENLLLESDPFSEELFLIDNTDLPDSLINSTPQNNSFAALFQAIIALIFVLLLIYLTLFILRKLMKRENVASSHIHILETQTIKVGSAISIVEIANRFFIVGLGENVTPIAEITEQEAIDVIKLSQAQKPQNQQSLRFFTLLKEQLNKKNIAPNTQAPAEEIIQKDFMKNYTNQLHRQNLTKNQGEDMHE